MPEIAMESVTALMRTKNRRGREPIRIGQVTPSVIRIERVAAMCAGPDLGSAISLRVRATPPNRRYFSARRRQSTSPKINGIEFKWCRYASELLCKTNSLMDGASVSLQPGTRSAVGAQ
ncbi:hypothetical protein [Mycobacterium avium]|uniref:hypothetical protein n=1 Tax=Mycobacterium avium TaxID=1764 RepID=UPI001592C0F5|nr:hypothetical protein [Mycobacterium avium]